MDAVIATLMAVSQLLADVPELAELDINPLIVNHEGAMALDARIRLSADKPAGAANFAIRPYPASWPRPSMEGAHAGAAPDPPRGRGPQHVEFLDQPGPEDIRMRVFYSRRTMERSELARLTQIDYTREMAFVAVPGPDGRRKRWAWRARWPTRTTWAPSSASSCAPS
jgi:acetyltransferase